uniref:C2H2-type domain-containing protein n=1 Tax=Timema douglasi TaxID=61478 RepID=A0A7R8V9E4_TIMDO|nr:unnamed protein product [Timema douglasi]
MTSQPSNTQPSTNTSGTYFHRGGYQQGNMYNPLLPSQGHSLYNGVFGAQSGFPTQNNYPPSGFNSYTHVEPSLWLPDTRVTAPSSVSLGNRGLYTDKNMLHESQSLTQACCSASIGTCSPLSVESYKGIDKELNFPQKSLGNFESQSWYCSPSVINYGNQQSQNMQQSYKCMEQFPSCSMAQVNSNLLEQTFPKDRIATHVPLQSCSVAGQKPAGCIKESDKPSCLELDKKHGTKCIDISNIYTSSVQQVSLQKQAEHQESYSNQSVFASSGGNCSPLSAEGLYSQASLFLHMSNENQSTMRSQTHYGMQKPLHLNMVTESCKLFSPSEGQLPIMHHFQDQNRCNVDPPMSCALIENSLQQESKSINAHSHLQVDTSSSNQCEQTSREVNRMSCENSFCVGTPGGPPSCLKQCEVVSDTSQVRANTSIVTLAVSVPEEESSSLGGESDIVVEETEEEDVSESEISIDESHTLKGDLTQCLVCSIEDATTQLVHITVEYPQTSASCTPVATKLTQVVASEQQFLKFQTEFICRRCLNLIDTVDCLENKLASLKHDILQLFGTKVVSLKELECLNLDALESEYIKKCVEEKVDDTHFDNCIEESVKIKPNENLVQNTSIEELHSENQPNTGENIEIPKETNLDEKVVQTYETVNSSVEVNDTKVINELSVTKNIDLPEISKTYDNNTVTGSLGAGCEKSVEKFQCEVCSKSFSSKGYLSTHNQQQHTDTPNFCCEKCFQKFATKQTFDVHQLIHTGECLHLCDRCGRLFRQRYSLDNHLRRHQDNYPLTCKYCGKGFLHTRALQVHIRSHTGERPFICEYCGHQFSSEQNLIVHIRTCSGDLPFNCDKCDKRFATMSMLQNHKYLHHEGKHHLKCSECEKGFLKNSDLKVHMRSHTNEKPHTCKICGKRYRNIGNLNQHMKTHLEDKPFKCELCSEMFVRRAMLTEHIKRHSGVKDYNCELCEKKFLTRRNLQAHRKWHSGTLKRYTCQVCGKILNHGLSAHMRTHSGDKPYTCLQCDATFTVRSSLNKHMKKHNRKI